MESARSFATRVLKRTVIGGFLSPVHDGYGKKSLVEAEHRVAMCELATEPSEWIMTDPWESKQPSYSFTHLVMTHFRRDMLMGAYGEEAAKSVAIYMVCGGDLVKALRNEEIWIPSSLEAMFDEVELIVTPREGPGHIGIHDWLHRDAPNLRKFRDRIHVMEDAIQSSVSSTLVRDRIARGESIRYLVPHAVEKYIYQHGLYGAQRVETGHETQAISS